MMNSFSLAEALDFVKFLNIHSKGSSLGIRDYQIVGVAKAIRLQEDRPSEPYELWEELYDVLYC